MGLCHGKIVPIYAIYPINSNIEASNIEESNNSNINIYNKLSRFSTRILANDSEDTTVFYT